MRPKKHALILSISNSNRDFANALHVRVSSVELGVCWVPRSGALPVRVVAQNAETSVVVPVNILVFPIDAHVAVVVENRSARRVWVIVSERAGLGEGPEAVVHLISISVAQALVLIALTLVGVPVGGPVRAGGDHDRWRVIEITLYAHSAAYIAIAEQRSRLVSENQHISEEGLGHHAGSDERLL